MVFYFIVFSFCAHVIDFTYERRPLILFFNPADIIEIKLSNESRAYFSEWKDVDDLYLEVEAFDDQNGLKSYGPFNHNDGLAAVQFTNQNFTLRFVYEGAYPAKFGVSFGNLPDYFVQDLGFNFPYTNEVITPGFTSHFAYYNDITTKKSRTVIIIMSCILGYLCVFILAFNSTGLCQKCQK